MKIAAKFLSIVFALGISGLYVGCVSKRHQTDGAIVPTTLMPGTKSMAVDDIDAQLYHFVPPSE